MKNAGKDKRGPQAPNPMELLEDVAWAARVAERQALGRLADRALLAGCMMHFRRAMAARLPVGIQDRAVELAVAVSPGGLVPGGGCQ